MWRCNHRSEPTLEQLQAFIRNSHDVVLRGDDKPCDARSVEKILAVQRELNPPLPKAKKARNKKKKCVPQQKKLNLSKAKKARDKKR